MGIQKRKAPKLRLEPIETCWFDDDAVDVKASDRDAWALAGTLDGVVTLPGHDLTRVRYRGLTEDELDVLPSGSSDEGMLARFYGAAEIGLLSIGGEQLERRRRDGALRITEPCRSRLAYDYKTPLPFEHLLHHYLVELGLPAGEEDPKARERLVELSLPTWVGVHVLIASFRARRGAT